MDTKQCIRCKEIKTIDNFNKTSVNKDGYKNLCRSCCTIQMRELRAKNPEKYKKYNQEWYQNNKERLQPLRNAKTREKWKNDPEYRKRKNEYKKEYFDSHPEYKKIRNRQNSIQHGGLLKKIDDNMFTQEEWQSLCARFDYRCVCCKQKKPLTSDHVIPISKGGKNTIDNIQPLCKKCNDNKSTKNTDYRQSFFKTG